MITGKGVGALTAALAIFFLARLTQVGWLYLVDAIFWGSLALGLIMPWVGVVFINARRVATTKNNKVRGTLSEGDLLTVTVSLQNRLFYPRFFHSVRYDSPVAGPSGAHQRFFVAHLPASGSLPMESTIEAYQRGLYHLGPVKLDSSVPFGFFRKQRSLTGTEPLLVLPKVHPLNRLILVDGLDGWSTQAQASRNGLDVAGSRPYVHGDSRRMVHWRNTARSGRLMVKETEDQTNRSLHIMFDSGDLWGVGKETNFEYAIKFAVSVADYALKNRVPVRVWGGGIHGSMFATQGTPNDMKGVVQSWSNLLELLALAQPSGPAAMTEGLGNIQSGDNLFIVLSTGDELGREGLRRAISRTGETVLVRLEGFGEPDHAEDPNGLVDQAGATVLTCGPGGLEKTLTNIQNLGRSNEVGAYDALSNMTAAGAGGR